MIENYLLEQFAAVAECGTLLKASEKLHISQPSLSRSMHKIEDEFGVSLFHRANSKIELNETGKIAAEYVPEHRNTIPITNPEVHITYWLAALNSEQKTYRSVFNTVCGNVLKEKAERDRESYIQPRPCYS